jgi:hypothetical protein
MHLVSVNPVTRKLQVFKDGQFVTYKPLKTNLELAPNLNNLVESTEQNFPVYLFNN